MRICQKERMREEGTRPSLLSLFIGSSVVFCLLRVRLEGPWGDQGIISRDPEEPWVEKVTTTKEVPLREPTRI